MTLPHSADKKTALILGGGLAGLACGVFLDYLGYDITLCEKKSLLGGRAYSFENKKMGGVMDNGQHLLMTAYQETLALLSLVGASQQIQKFKKNAVPLFYVDGKKDAFTIHSLPSPLSTLLGLLRLKAFSLKEKWGILKLGNDLKKKSKNLDYLKHITVEDWLKQYHQGPQAIANFWEILTLATLNEHPSKVSAYLLAQVLVLGFILEKKTPALLIPKNDLSTSLIEPLRAYLTLRGHKILTSQAASKIHVLNNKVQNVEFEDGTKIKSDVTISALPPHALLPLIPEGFVNQYALFSNLNKFSYSPIISINLWFDEEVMEDEFLGVAGKKIHWYFNKNKIHQLPGKHQHVMGVISGAHDFVDLGRDDFIDMARTEMAEVFPKSAKATLVHSMINKELRATVSFTPETELIRPDPKTPFDNFFICGDWTNTGLPATIESAVVSAKKVSLAM